MRAYVEALHAGEQGSGPLPPIYLATLRDKMLDLAAEIADGAIWANAARSAHGRRSSTGCRRPRGTASSLANMVPTVIDDDRAAADAINRRTLTGYVALPNYRNYWKQAGYVEEMEAIEAALAAGDRDNGADAHERRVAATTARSAARPPRSATASTRGGPRACRRSR